MKLKNFEDYNEFTLKISNTFNSLDCGYDNISIIAKYSEAKKLLKELLCMGYDISTINLESEEISGYSDEYIISILNIDGENSVWCDKFKDKDKYFDDEATVTYIMDNCSSKVIKHCKANIMFEVHIGEEDDVDSIVDENNNDVHGFTVSNTDSNGYCSFSYYSTNPLNQTEIQKMINDFGFSFSE